MTTPEYYKPEEGCLEAFEYCLAIDANPYAAHIIPYWFRCTKKGQFWSDIEKIKNIAEKWLDKLMDESSPYSLYAQLSRKITYPNFKHTDIRQTEIIHHLLVKDFVKSFRENPKRYVGICDIAEDVRGSDPENVIYNCSQILSLKPDTL